MTGPSRARAAFGDVIVEAVRRALVWGLLSGVLGSLLLLAGARWVTPATIDGPVADPGWTGRTRAWFTSRGFQVPRLETGTGREFSWTYARARMTVPNLNRAHAYRLSFDVNSYRPGAMSLPSVTVAVDGEVKATLQTTADRQWMTGDVPARSTRGLIVTIEPSDTFEFQEQPGHALGVMVNAIRLEAIAGYFRPSWAVLALTALAIAGFVAGAILCGLARELAAGLSVATTVGLVWLLLLDAAYLGNDVWRLVWIGASVASSGGVVLILRAGWSHVAGWPEWSKAIGIVLVLSALKLAFFTHPQIALADGAFQAHRAQLVHRGEYFFTSVTPSPSFEFPYAILLYLAALPFWSWFPTLYDLVNLLRGLALSADALIGVAIYGVVRRQWRHEPTALLCAAMWVMTRAPAMALGHANLTNLFGQGLFGVAMAGVAWMAVGARASIRALAATTAVLTAAFLSHFSTLSMGIVLLSAVAGACVVAGGRALRPVGLRVFLVLTLAVSTSYVVYYSHFNDLYVRMFTRVTSGVDEVSDRSMVAPAALKLQRWLTEDQFSNDYGLPGLALFLAALVGLARLLRERPREGLTLVLLVWSVVWAGASALGILTSVELRANLASAPMFVYLAGYGLWWLTSRSPVGRTIAAVGVAAIAWGGLRVWLFWLGAV